MAEFLVTKLNHADRECMDPAATPLRLSVGNEQSRLEHILRDQKISAVTSPAVALIRLMCLSAEVNPEPEILHEPRTIDGLFRWARGEISSAGGIVREYLFAEKGGRALKEIETELRLDVQCVHEEARRRLGLKRSMRGIVGRYAARAMWHEAASLRKLGNVARKAEDLLAADFARYLHDQGLNPLTKPMTGGLQPDLLGPLPRWTFYAEAKQYKDRAARGYLIKGMHQVWDTLGRLRGTPYEVHEAFYVIFRRAGPRFVFPDELRAEGVTVYPFLIDIAEGGTSGSRQKEQPVSLAAAELLPQ
jgi:hypothetical protein